MGLHLFKIKDLEEDDSYKLLPLCTKSNRTRYGSIKKAFSDDIVHCCTTEVIFITLEL